MLKLKVQYFEYLMWRTDSFQKTLTLGKIEGRTRRGRQGMRWWMASASQWIWVWVNSRSWWLTGRPGVLQSMGSQRVRHDWATELNPSFHLVKAMIFPVVMYGCETTLIKKAECQRIDAFKMWCWRRLSRVPWTAKEINPVNPKGNQSWIYIGRTDAEAEASVLWPPDAKCRLIGKDPDAGKDWGQEEKGMTEDEMVRWHHQLNGHEFMQTSREGQGSLSSCMGCK